MDKQIITFSANEQNLVRIGGEYHYSSNKVSYIGAHFDLGANWDGFDSVRAVWFTDRINGISTVLDGEGNCTVPTEVLKKKDRVFVNLVGSIVSNGELTDRLTTYPAVALVVDSKAKVDSTETAPVTPSQFEQFVSIVQDAVANIKDIVSTTLNADYTLTFVYSDGTSYTTPSIRGERGPQGADGADGTDGNGIASAVLNSNYTLTLTFADGTSYTTPSIRGAQGPKGDPGDVSQAQLDAAVSDLKSALTDETNARILLAGRMTTAEGDIDSLESQFTTVVSAVTTDTEVTNIRVGDDGVTYDTAGNAVRKQFSGVKGDYNNYCSFLGYETIKLDKWVQGERSTSDPYVPDGTPNRVTTAIPAKMHKGDKVTITIPDGKKVGLITSLGFASGWLNYSPYPFQALSDFDLFIVMANSDTSTAITPSDAAGSSFAIKIEDGSTRIKQLETWRSEASPLLLNANVINTAGYTVNNGRIYSASNDTKRSDFIPVSAGAKIAYRLSGVSAFNLISFYTDRSATSSSAPSYVSGVAGQAAGTYTEGVFTAPSDGYIVVTNMTAYTDIYLGGVDGFYGIDKRLDALEDASGAVDLTGKYILNFGDSLGHGYGNGNKSYAYMLAQETGATLADYAVNGTPYANYGLTDSYACVCNQVKSAISDHSSHDVAIILVEGGINDLKRNVLDIGTLTDNYDGTYAQNMIIGATEYMFYRLKNAFPSAKIVFVMYHKMPLSTTTPSLSYTDMYARQETEHAGLKSACEKWSVPMADVYAEGSLNSNIQSMAETYFGVDAGEKFGRDIAHPNALGYRKFYIPLIKAQLLKLTYEKPT